MGIEALVASHSCVAGVPDSRECRGVPKRGAQAWVAAVIIGWQTLSVGAPVDSATNAAAAHATAL